MGCDHTADSGTVGGYHCPASQESINNIALARERTEFKILSIYTEWVLLSYYLKKGYLIIKRYKLVTGLKLYE